MNIDNLKYKIKITADMTGLTVQEIWDKYFFEQFLIRLSKSKYKENFVLKGGYLLENVIGIMHRTTLDLDFSYRLANINEKEIEKRIKSIIKLDINDKVKYEFKDINVIDEIGNYGGYRVRLTAKIGNIRKTFGIDIASGDIITPAPERIQYKTNITEEIIDIHTYNRETILAEKFQTVIERNLNNTRMKDFFDIYVLINHKDLNKELLHDVIVNTFENRNTEILKKQLEITLNKIVSSEFLKAQYENYTKKTKFAKNTTYQDIKEALIKTFSLIKYTVSFIPKFKTLMIIRHGEDEQNKMGGWSNNKLTEKGIAQVIKLKDDILEKFKVLKSFSIISSDLTRAKETVEILFNGNYTIHYDMRLRECNNGDLKDLTKEEFYLRYPKMHFSSLNYDEKYPNGESPEDFYNRVSNYILELNEKCQNENLIIVTHKGIYGILKSMINGIVWSNK